jgi:hypothetical protein
MTEHLYYNPEQDKFLVIHELDCGIFGVVSAIENYGLIHAWNFKSKSEMEATLSETNWHYIGEI